MGLQSYVEGKWLDGKGSEKPLLDASTGEFIANAYTEALDFESILHYSRTKAGPILRQMTFHERARRLKRLALHLLEKKNHFYKISSATGATKIDSWIDIEGGIGNLFVMSSKGRREMPDEIFYVDGNPEMLSKEGSFIGHHIYVPKEGCAIHINAFNFPVWGMLEKIACNLLAGVPSVVKPATITSYLTEAVVREIISSEILPEGSLQLICGSARGILDHVTNQDVVTFTGSAQTGKMLKAHPNIVEHSVPFNMEADSLNCSILGPDATPDTEEFNIFVKEVAKEMTVKTGQKCTAIRRTIVPENLLEDVSKALQKRLEKTVIGDPREEGVRMGPLASRDQLHEVQEKIEALKKDCQLVYGGHNDFSISGGSKEKGAFISPTLLHCDSPLNTSSVHDIEAFGPVNTLMPYKDVNEAITLAKMGQGSLVGSVVTSNDGFARDIVLGTAASHGRLVVLNKDCAKESTGHGSPMPQLVHGGPGRAGGGEEMGGVRGVFHYMQRTAIQGHPSTITALTNNYQIGAKQTTTDIHPFKKYFEDLRVGESHHTHKRTITDADIVNFANLSWDHFYAHTDVTSLEGTLFEKRVAHGYFIMSAAAGLFVEPNRGPVLANYGLDELRFIKPVYAGATINVTLTVKEKVNQDDREGEIPRGIVKWQVNVFDETGESVALATILTLVQKRPMD